MDRGGRDDGAAGLVGERLQDERRAVDGVGVRAVEAVVLLVPGTPGRDRVGQDGQRVQRRRRGAGGVGGPLQDEPVALAGLQA
jgi:hypothetical protein